MLRQFVEAVKASHGRYLKAEQDVPQMLLGYGETKQGGKRREVMTKRHKSASETSTAVGKPTVNTRRRETWHGYLL